MKFAGVARLAKALINSTRFATKRDVVKFQLADFLLKKDTAEHAENTAGSTIMADFKDHWSKKIRKNGRAGKGKRHPGYSREYLEKSMEEYKKAGGKITVMGKIGGYPPFITGGADMFLFGGKDSDGAYVSHRPKNRIY
jgi:hypothetical protein